jgi:hypothetical protein
MLELCASCAVARPRSRVKRVFSLIALGLGIVALVGTAVGISHSHGSLVPAYCASSPALSQAPGARC